MGSETESCVQVQREGREGGVHLKRVRVGRRKIRIIYGGHALILLGGGGGPLNFTRF